MGGWIGAIFILLTGAGILSARLCCYRREVRHLRGELEMLKEDGTNFMLTAENGVGGMDKVISDFNRILDENRRRISVLCKENESYRESIINISHDIRTPLTSAKGYVQMLCNESVTEEKRRNYAKVIERRLDELAGMLDQLFLYARLTAGEVTFAPERLNAGNLFAETLSLFYEDFVERDCEPEVLIGEQPCYIMADRQAFVRIMENLIKNALVHGSGGYEMVLRRQQGTVRIRVSNRTTSIGEEDVGHIFERFYTTDLSRSRRATGLGLAIVKELSEQMGGGARAELVGDIFSVEVWFRNIVDEETKVE